VKSPKNTAFGPDYVVDFNPEIAWTLTYDDSLGRLVFVFEAGDTPEAVILDRTPLENNRVLTAQDAATRTRVNLAFARTKAFLEACGYDVEAH